MQRIIEIIGALISGGMVAIILEAYLSRRLRHNRDLRAYRNTVNLLMDDYAKLIAERTKLLRELSDLGITPEDIPEMTDDQTTPLDSDQPPDET
ncbi:hypothetical protein [uncultured Porphyromonas sp.]|uniref:hypothetical protein n=1 Tax=uncultured Porphyromonas sp. TaxID=159274 RepID=UPI00262E6187|nr:hypothetical protein [uncultured Porphyromonas sp.]